MLFVMKRPVKRKPPAAAQGVMRAFANRLKSLREARALSQVDLARLLKIGRFRR